MKRLEQPQQVTSELRVDAHNRMTRSKRAVATRLTLLRGRLLMSSFIKINRL